MVLFSFIVATGLIVRRLLERMKLLLVPRIAVMLTVVVFILAVSSLAAFGSGLERALSVALFPFVIMTMIVERMSARVGGGRGYTLQCRRRSAPRSGIRHLC